LHSHIFRLKIILPPLNPPTGRPPPKPPPKPPPEAQHGLPRPLET